MRDKLEIFFFCLLTWGVILGLPLLMFFIMKSSLGESNRWVPWVIWIVVFIVYIKLID